jgi:hypothetical protein
MEGVILQTYVCENICVVIYVWLNVIILFSSLPYNNIHDTGGLRQQVRRGVKAE